MYIHIKRPIKIITFIAKIKDILRIILTICKCGFMGYSFEGSSPMMIHTWNIWYILICTLIKFPCVLLDWKIKEHFNSLFWWNWIQTDFSFFIAIVFLPCLIFVWCNFCFENGDLDYGDLEIMGLVTGGRFWIQLEGESDKVCWGIGCEKWEKDLS